MFLLYFSFYTHFIKVILFDDMRDSTGLLCTAGSPVDLPLGLLPPLSAHDKAASLGTLNH